MDEENLDGSAAQRDGIDNLEQLRTRAQHIFKDFETHYQSILDAMQEGIMIQEEIEDRMRSLSQFPGHNPNPMLQVTPEGVIRYANSASALLLEHWASGINQLVPPGFQAYINQVLKTGERTEAEVNVDGRTLSLSIAPYSNKQHINIYGLDITDRKQTEVALRESEETTRMLLESAPIGIIIIDDSANITMVNQQASVMFGYEKTELLRQPIGQLVPEVYREVHTQQCLNFRNDPRVRPMGSVMDLTGLRKDGSIFPTEISLGFIRTKQELLVMAFIVDISQKQEIEAQRENLMRMMVHDLRSPLASTLTSLEYLRAISGDALEDDHLKLLDIAVNSADKMLKLVNAILDVNRLKSGAMPLVRNIVDVPDIVNDLMDEVGVMADDKNISMTMEIPDSLPPVYVDSLLITRVIQNLVNNAIKFTPDGGSITMKAWWDLENAQKSVAAESGGNVEKIYFQVQDTGPGIAQDIRDRLFQEFVTGKLPGRGSGLGLAFCKLAVEAHDERIWVESDPGKGATFTFTLPVADEE
ncbi:MAG: PAS domain S-box protein [Anaerolineae bacterium]|nr:PAS domain S-box protein [Anaerolineae bacterium]